MSRYDTLGRTYARTRATDPSIAATIWAALGDARTVVNVGAGTGSYEPPDRELTAVEPSEVMIAQRPPDAAPAVQASAEALPFEDSSFDAAMAVLTLHTGANGAAARPSCCGWPAIASWCCPSIRPSPGTSGSRATTSPS